MSEQKPAEGVVVLIGCCSLAVLSVAIVISLFMFIGLQWSWPYAWAVLTLCLVFLVFWSMRAVRGAMKELEEGDKPSGPQGIVH